LVDKLGIKPGARLQFASPPKHFAGLLGELPDGSRVTARGRLDFAILFVKERAGLKKGFSPLRDRLEPNGMLWVAWPKKASGMDTDLSEEVVRAFGLESGLVDVKVCPDSSSSAG
jgi:hypothetical protein